MTVPPSFVTVRRVMLCFLVESRCCLGVKGGECAFDGSRFPVRGPPGRQGERSVPWLTEAHLVGRGTSA